MQKMTIPQRLRAPRPEKQRGVALFVVIIFVMLSMLLALWAARTSLFNELVVGNDADYQRAFEAAQALLQDAELDIRGENADGSACKNGSADICRTTTPDQIPLEAKDVTNLLATLTSEATLCRNALCAKRNGEQDFWNDKNTLDAMKSVGARFGQYTGASKGDYSNPILAETDIKKGGWYWIEVLPYYDSQNSGVVVGAPSNLLELNLTPHVVYRITALAYGRKPNTMVVLQQTYARQKHNLNLPGR